MQQIESSISVEVLNDVRRAIGNHIPTVIRRGNVERVARALQSMYMHVLTALSSVARCEDSAAFRLQSRTVLRRVAGEALLRELRLCGELREPELGEFRDAIALTCIRHGAGWAESPEPSEFALSLAVELGSASSRLLLYWPLKEQASDRADHSRPTAERLTLDQVRVLFGDPPDDETDDIGSLRKGEFNAFRMRQRKAGRPVTAPKFAKKAGVSRTRFYEGWLGGEWANGSPEAQRIRKLLTEPVEFWAER